MPTPANTSMRPISPSKVSKTKRSKISSKSLKSGRPPILSTPPTSRPSNTESKTPEHASNVYSTTPNPSKRSSKATKALINTHHNLHKSRVKAVTAGELDLVRRIDEQIAQIGGLQAYQQASLTGQSADRGGDSSIILVKWLEELIRPSATTASSSNNPSTHEHTITPTTNKAEIDPRLRVLEVGALSSRNAISRAMKRKHGITLIDSVKRIDLNSQEPEHIEQIDFMDLPVPLANDEKYDILSLSLVLNYVAQPGQRGAMLRRTRQFLRDTTKSHQPTTTNEPTAGDRAESSGVNSDMTNERSGISVPTAKRRSILPCLFVVLPLPCLTNSRYLNGDRFRELMAMLGYESIKAHQSAKLHYELFHWNGSRPDEQTRTFRKVQVNPGKSRNNFCITLESG